MLSVTPVRDRILDAAIDVAIDHGIARLSVGDVARRAGLSRQTLYKYFPSKQALVAEAVLREAGEIVRRVIEAAVPFDDPRDALEAGFLATLRLTREHPLLDRLVRTEPGSLLPLLTSAEGPVMSAARTAVEGIIELKIPEISADQRRRGADVIARLLVSYAVGPPKDRSDLVAATMADFFTVGMLAPTVRA
jgi:AcrR family transcriptional regulator